MTDQTVEGNDESQATCREKYVWIEVMCGVMIKVPERSVKRHYELEKEARRRH